MRRSLFLLLLPSVLACQSEQPVAQQPEDTDAPELTVPGTTPSPDTDEPETDCPFWHADADADSWGDPDVSVQSCDQPEGYVENKGDCDDSDPETYPDSTRLLDGVDSDCDAKKDWLVDIWVSVDDAFELCVDDQDEIVGGGAGWEYGYHFEVWLDSGEHVIGIKGWDLHYAVTAAIGHIEASTGDVWVTDGSWQYDPSPAADTDIGWCAPGFDDTSWPAVAVHGPIGTAPWNAVCGAAPCDFPVGSPAQWIWDHFPVELNTQYLRKEIVLP